MTTKCALGHEWYKEYLKDKKIYWCQMCSCDHIFTPHEIKDYAPFTTVEEALKFQDEMRKQQNAVYHNNGVYKWRN